MTLATELIQKSDTENLLEFFLVIASNFSQMISLLARKTSLRRKARRTSRKADLQKRQPALCEALDECDQQIYTRALRAAI